MTQQRLAQAGGGHLQPRLRLELRGADRCPVFVSLMLSVNPALTAAQIVQGLRASARPHVTSSSIGPCSPIERGALPVHHGDVRRRHPGCRAGGSLRDRSAAVRRAGLAGGEPGERRGRWRRPTGRDAAGTETPQRAVPATAAAGAAHGIGWLLGCGAWRVLRGAI
jgi:hypothetical protein